jgi:hypothetical protein
VGHDLHIILMLSKVPKVTNDAKKLLGQHVVDDSNVHVDALVTNEAPGSKYFGVYIK